MQQQATTFIGSFGGAVAVTNESTMVPVVQMQQAGSVANLTEKKGSESANEKRKLSQDSRRGTVNRFEQVRNPRQPNRFE